MIIGPPPLAIAPDGSSCALGIGSTVWTFDTATGERAISDVPLSALLVSVPHGAGRHIAVADHDRLAFVGGATHELPGHAVRLVEGADELFVVTRSDSVGTYLSVFERDTDEPHIEPTALGAVAIDSAIAVNGSRLILSGRRGSRAWEGVGEAFLRAVRVGDGSVDVIWSGDPFMGADHPTFLAAGNGTVVLSIVDPGTGESVHVLDADELLAHGVSRSSRLGIDDAEVAAVSPSGHRFAVITSVDGRPLVRSGIVGDLELVDHGAVSAPAPSARLAVDDTGRVVVAEFADAHTLRVLSAGPRDALEPTIVAAVTA